jgi:hypothetical protein
MASTYLPSAHRARPWYASIDAEIALRVLLAIAAVGVCYRFEWHWLRALTASLNLRLDAVAGVSLHRVADDMVVWRGATYRYVIACTFADVWCAAIPLVWDLRRALSRNLLTVFLLALALVLFNVVRLSASDVLFARGLPWWLAHDVLGGVAYFIVWTWVWEHRGWAPRSDQ